MRTLHLYIVVAVGVSGLFVFNDTAAKNNAQSDPGTTNTYITRYDSTPAKTVYRDLNTGETIDIWYDRTGLRTLNKKTGAPVDFYVNTATNDTVIGQGKFIVNGYVVKGDDGKWKLDDGKVKVDGDELKIKVGDQKFKVDGDEIKIKGNGTKAKLDDGEVKVKTKDGKAKYEDDKIKVKEKTDGNDSTKIKIDNK